MVISLYINKVQVFAILDSGSDVSILDRSYLRRIFPKSKIDLTPTNIKLTSFSTDPIPIEGSLELPLAFHPQSENTINTNLLISNNRRYFFPFVLGLDFLVKANLKIEVSENHKKLAISTPILEKNRQVKSTLANPSLLYSPEFKVKHLPPRQFTKIRITLPFGTPVTAKDRVFITPTRISELFVFPSVSHVFKYGNSDCWQCYAAVINLKNIHLSTTSRANIEIVEVDTKLVHLKNKSKNEVANLLRRYPLIKQIIPSDYQSDVYIPSINAIVVKEKLKNHKNVNDILDFDEIILDSELEFSDELINNTRAIEVPLSISPS